MRRIFLAVFALFWISGCVAVRTDTLQTVAVQETIVISAEQRTAGSELFIVRESGRVGYINHHGEVVVVPRFEDGGHFSEGLARVRLGGLWGYIAPDGSWSIEPQFLDASDFSQSRARVVFQGAATDFGSRQARPVDRLLSGFIDPAGNLIGEANLSQARDFAAIGNQSITIVEMIVQRKLVPFGMQFLAPISPTVQSRTSWHLIDDLGNEIAEIRNADRVNAFSDGIAAFLERTSITRPLARWGFIGPDGTVIISPQFSAIGPFSEGLAAAAVGGQFGFIDVNGTWVIEPTFELTGPFRDGLARVRYGGNWGFIDTSGEFVIAPSFEAATDFSEGLAAVQQAGKFGYVRADGSFALTPQFDQAGPFRNGLALVRSQSHNSYITPDGTAVWSGRAE